jgi:hypothetical protein
VLPAISLEKGFLHCKVIEGSFRSDSFALFIQNVLEHMEPFPGPNSVIVMDNCRIHKSPYIQELIRSRFVVKLACYLLLMAKSSEVFAVNFCLHILRSIIRLNSRSRG